MLFEVSNVEFWFKSKIGHFSGSGCSQCLEQFLMWPMFGTGPDKANVVLDTHFDNHFEPFWCDFRCPMMSFGQCQKLALFPGVPGTRLDVAKVDLGSQINYRSAFHWFIKWYFVSLNGFQTIQADYGDDLFSPEHVPTISPVDRFQTGFIRTIVLFVWSLFWGSQYFSNDKRNFIAYVLVICSFQWTIHPRNFKLAVISDIPHRLWP